LARYLRANPKRPHDPGPDHLYDVAVIVLDDGSTGHIDDEPVGTATIRRGGAM
jgi:hypothetical protein